MKLNVERVILVAILLLTIFETAVLLIDGNRTVEAKPIEQKEGYWVEVEEVPQELLEMEVTYGKN